MKTPSKIHYPQLSHNNLLIVTLVLVSLILLSIFSFGQTPEPLTSGFNVELIDTNGQVLCREEINKEIVLTDIGSSTLITFKVIYNGGKVYTQWHVKGEKEDGLFIVERSVNGKVYEQIGFKTGIGVPIEAPILYCWIDENPLVGSCLYRLAKVYEDGRYYYSEATGTTSGQLIKSVYKEGPPLIAVINE